MNKSESLRGQIFMHLTVLYKAASKNNKTFWVCKCRCEKKVTVRQDSLKSGATNSCGCYRKEVHTTHGASGSRAYVMWANMNSRGHNKNIKGFKYWGGRGITVCDRWRYDFNAFFEDMGECPRGLTLDRKDNNKGYYKENCHYVTPTEQNRNRRKKFEHSEEFLAKQQLKRDIAELM